MDLKITRGEARLRSVVGIFCVLLLAALVAPVQDARALTGNDGLIAIATENGVEVFDPSGDGSDRHVLIPNEPGVSLHEPAWSPEGGGSRS